MSADQLRHKAQQSQRKARLEALLQITIGLVLSVFFAWTCAKAHDGLPRLGLGVLSLWGLYAAWQAYRCIWPGRLGPDATVSTSLEFYRGELEKRRDYSLHVWRRAGLTFCFLGLAMVVLPELIKSFAAPRLLLNVAPVLVLLALWVAIFIPMRKRNQRKLQLEIDGLRLFERENPS
jgi:NhaP-type Na+/H+ or K+/H+ antiporter